LGRCQVGYITGNVYIFSYIPLSRLCISGNEHENKFGFFDPSTTVKNLIKIDILIPNKPVINFESRLYSLLQLISQIYCRHGLEKMLTLIDPSPNRSPCVFCRFKSGERAGQRIRSCSSNDL
jgi:hypothetical protein